MREIVTAQRLIDRSKAAEKALEILERNDQIVRDIGGQGLAPIKTDEMGRPQADLVLLLVCVTCNRCWQARCCLAEDNHWQPFVGGRTRSVFWASTP